METSSFFGKLGSLFKSKKREYSISTSRKVTIFCITVLLLVVLFFVSATTGTINVGVKKLLSGLFVKRNPNIVAIWDLRFPRILIAIMVEAAIATSGALLQAVMKNSLTDPGIIGISSAANLFVVLISTFVPNLYF